MNRSINYTITIILVAGILIFLNLVARQYYFRIDLTEDGQYTLSKATKDILKSMEEPLTVKAYFTKNMPPALDKIKSEFESILIEYNRISDGNIAYQFINPNESEQIEQEAQQAGIQPTAVQIREKDQVKQQRAYLGAVLELGDQKEIIPFIQPGAALEYALSTAIKKMSVLDKPSIGFIQGHGEPALEEMIQAQVGLSVLYEIEGYELTDTLPINDRFKTLAIIRPTESISAAQLANLDAYLERGGNLVVALNRVNGDLQTASGTEVNTGLETWLEGKGVIVDPNFVIDASCGSVTVQPQQGQGGFLQLFQQQIEFPYLPIITTFADHPISKGLEAVILQFASPVRYTGSADATFTPIAFTSEISGSLAAPQYFDINKQWTQNDFPLANQAIAGVLEKDLPSGKKSKIVVIGDGDFAINGPQGQQQQLQADNVNLLVNSIDWMSDDSGLIDLRTKGVRYRPIEEMEDGRKSFLKYLNFLLPILLIAAYGIFRAQVNRNKRIKRMQESYEN